MNELIQVKLNDLQEPIVSGRELHEFLEIGTNYTDWFKRMVEYGFDEGKDFISILGESSGGRPSTDHALKMDMAKEISMIQRNEKGKQARQYFIEVEKKHFGSINQQKAISPELQALQGLINSMVQQEIAQKKLETKVDNIQSIIEVRPYENWREETNGLINKISKATGNYQSIRQEIYKALEIRGGCNLNIRLKNMKSNALYEGQNKTNVSKLNNLDVIENDKKLKELYVAIVKDFAVKYLPESE